MSIKSFLASISSLFSNPKKTSEKNLNEFQVRIEVLKESMISYMRSAKPSYNKRDVEKCAEILNRYLDELEQTTSKEQGMQVVKATVFKLNELSEKKEDLIETAEREEIAEIIILSSSRKGYNSPEEDITEEWREW